MHIEKEKDNLQKVFLSNGYTTSQINKVFSKAKRHQRRSPESTKESNVGDQKAFIPYIGVTSKISKNLKKKNNDTMFSLLYTIKKLFISLKDHVHPLLEKGVYQIPCT